jgi:hypothetical protein
VIVRRWAGVASMTVLAATLGAAPAALAASSSPSPGLHTVSEPLAPNAKQPSNLQQMDSGLGPTVAQREGMAAAAAQAHRTGKPVVVDALTTESQQTAAQPKGGFALTANPQPVRAKQNGAWTPVDTSLHKGADGLLAPAATAYGAVRFSAGGSGPLVTTTSGGTRYSVNWPTALPSPSVSGSTATYPEVLPGVDLVLSATPTGGFSDVLVVKNAQAAKNPALANLQLAASVAGGKMVNSKAEDGISVTSDGQGGSLDSGTPMMWDSSAALPATAPQAGGKTAKVHTQSQAAAARMAPDASDAGHPGAAAHIAVVHAKASANSLALVPDAKLLSDPGTVFPVYVDPTFNWHPASTGNPAFDEVKQGSPCNGVSLYDNAGSAGDNGQLGVGVNGWSSCQGIMRSYFQWQLPSVMYGADIQSGTVNATKIWSASCSENPTVYLHWSGGINSGTSWNSQPGYGGALSSAQFGPAFNGTYCPGNGTVTHGLDVTGPMKQASTGRWGTFTGVLTEDDYESSGSDAGFSRFADNPSLQIQYNLHPNTPGVNDLSAVSGAQNAGCATNTPYPLMGKTIATNTPVLRSYVSDPDQDPLQATFKYWVDGSSTTATGLSGDNLGSNTVATFSLPPLFVSSLTDGQVVDWQAQVSDGEATSDWSPVCHFTAYPTGPNNPSIPANSTYPDADNHGKTGAPAGTSSTFTINSATDGGAPTTKLIYGLDQQPATSNTPANQVLPVASSAAANPAGRWLMNDNSGNQAKDSSGGNHPLTFTVGSTWSSDSTRGPVVDFNGTTGYGDSGTPVLDTSKSYTVAAWVKPNDLTNGWVVDSQAGTTEDAFQVYYSSWAHSWAFGMHTADSTTATLPAIYGPNTGANSPQVGTWASVVGVYNATNQQMQLYVNGALVASGTFSGTAWNASGPLQVSHAIALNDFANGYISDVQAYQRVLTADEIATINSSANVTITPLSAGPHTLWAAASDAANDQSGMTAYRFIADKDHPQTCASFTACLNNTAISPDSNMGLGAADGANSFSATDLTNDGWNSGQPVTLAGATFTLPAFGSGQADNILAANQTIPLQGTAATAGSSLVFLATSTHAALSTPGAVAQAAAPFVPAGTAVTGEYCFDSTRPAAYCPASGTVNYSDGTQSSYSLVVPDWVTGPNVLAGVTLPHWNTPSGQISPTGGAKLFPFSIPLTVGKTPVSVTLPDTGAQAGAPALHIFGMATRNTTTGTAEANGTTVSPAAGQSWTAAWGVPASDGWSSVLNNTYSNQTFRTNLKPSVSGNTVRIKLDNTGSSQPLVVTHATIALASGGAQSAVPSGATTDLKFGGNAGVTVPAGAMVYSDPLPFSVTANQNLLVSFAFSNSFQYLAGNRFANTAWMFMSAAGSGDLSTDTTGTPFGTGLAAAAFLSDVDVTTAGVPTQAMFGDGVIDFGELNETNLTATSAVRLGADLATAAPSTPSAAPFSMIDESINGNEIATDYPLPTAGTAFPPPSGGPSALSRIDRDLLDQPGLNTVVIDEGLQDILRGQTADNLTKDYYTQLLGYLQASGINVIAVGLTPCDGFQGGGGIRNSIGGADPCTSTVDKYRTTVNRWLEYNSPLGMVPVGPGPNLYYIDPDAAIGVNDSTNGEIKLNPQATMANPTSTIALDGANLSTAGYGGLANAVLGPQDTWLFHDAAGSTASDTAGGSGYNTNAFQSTNPATGQNSLSLHGGYSWTTGAEASNGNTVKLDGTTGYGSTAGAVLNGSGSFSVSATVNLSSTANDATVAAQNGAQGSLFALQYNHAKGAWCFNFSPSDGAALAANSTCATTTGSGWTSLVGTYDASSQTASLYVNGTLAGQQTGVTPWTAGGTFTVGAAQASAQPTAFFPGMITNAQVWTYVLTAPQAMALQDGIGRVH